MQLTTCQTKALDILTDWYFDDSKKTATLIGSAGTGKTFLSKYFLDKVRAKCTVTAPTHKAKFVISRATGRPSNTIQKILGFRPDFSIENFDINNAKFAATGKVEMQGDLLLIDEASMLGKDLKRYIEEIAKDFNFKVLYIGDKRQLPPIGEATSTVFDKVDTKAELRTLVRQGLDNPLMILLLALRVDIADLCKEDEHESYELLLELADNKELEVTPDLIKANRGKLFKYFLLNNLCAMKDGKGITLLRKNKDFVALVKEEFGNNKLGTRLLAYTNDRVTEWNAYIRNNILQQGEKQYIAVGDLLTGYLNNGTIYNGCDYIVTSSKEATFDGIPIYQCKLIETDESQSYDCNIIRYTDEDAFKKFQKGHEANHLKARTSFGASRRENWQAYYDWFKQYNVPYSMNKEEFIHPELNIEPKNLPKKTLDYGSALTVHKSQGSTFETVLIDGEDLIKAAYQNKLMFYQMMYVASSRASHRCHIYFP